MILIVAFCFLDNRKASVLAGLEIIRQIFDKMPPPIYSP